MTTLEFCRLMRVSLSEAQMRACRYLERRGLRFAIDFGYQNAVDTARRDWRERRRRKKVAR